MGYKGITVLLLVCTLFACNHVSKNEISNNILVIAEQMEAIEDLANVRVSTDSLLK